MAHRNLKMLLLKEKRRWRIVGKRSMTLMIVKDRQKNTSNLQNIFSFITAHLSFLFKLYSCVKDQNST